jgi:hypothetical protein
LNSTDVVDALAPTRYARTLAERRETDQIRQLSQFGLLLGWLFTLTGGFCWFCVVGQMDWFWRSLMMLGIAMLLLGTFVPQTLAWPHRQWMRLAHLQGWLVMTVLLTVTYFTLIWPLGWWERKRRGSSPFFTWDGPAPRVKTGWQPLTDSPVHKVARGSQKLRSRSLLWLFFDTLAFFSRRGHYLLLPVLILLLVLGLILFFVQSSVLAPFIYTIAVAI